MTLLEIRSKYVEYIAAGIRYIQEETKLSLPEDTILICKSYCELARFDKIIGMEVYISDIPSDYDFFIAFKSRHKNSVKLLKCFEDYLSTFDMEE